MKPSKNSISGTCETMFFSSEIVSSMDLGVRELRDVEHIRLPFETLNKK
ncbi:hypothetical protein ES705_15359 [subsurface metagenome]